MNPQPIKGPPDNPWSQMMTASIAGDEGAYRRLLEDLGRSVRAMARGAFARAGVGDADVEDAVQETLLSIHLKRHTWDPEQPLAPWVYAIARHKVVDALRRRGRRKVEPLENFEEFLAAPGALRLIGDLLPPATAVRALQVLGEDLRARRAPGAVLPERSVDSRQGACEQVPTEPGGPVATRDTLLTPLVKGTSSELSQAAPTKASAEVNHDLLASLTKTDPGTLPPDQKGT